MKLESCGLLIGVIRYAYRMRIEGDTECFIGEDEDLSFFDVETNPVEILGNIYENPELLEGVEE